MLADCVASSLIAHARRCPDHALPKFRFASQGPADVSEVAGACLIQARRDLSITLAWKLSKLHAPDGRSPGAPVSE